MSGSYRAAPIIRLLDNLSARGSGGSAISLHSSDMSAVKTERFGSFLKDDFAPSVAASLHELSAYSLLSFTRGVGEHVPEQTIAAIPTLQQVWREEHGERTKSVRSLPSRKTEALCPRKLRVEIGLPKRAVSSQELH